MTIPNKTDLTGKVAVVTGGGGVLCSTIARALAAAGAKVAVLDLREEAARKVADAIAAEGGVAKGYACNVLEKESLEKVRAAVEADLGPVDVLLNGAGGNHPKGTTSNEPPANTTSKYMSFTYVPALGLITPYVHSSNQE